MPPKSRGSFRGRTVDKNGGHKGRPGSTDVAPARNRKHPRTVQIVAKATASRNLEGTDLDDEEDRRIAELEKKLGMDKEKRMRGEDDGLDGVPACHFCVNDRSARGYWNIDTGGKEER